MIPFIKKLWFALYYCKINPVCIYKVLRDFNFYYQAGGITLIRKSIELHIKLNGENK